MRYHVGMPQQNRFRHQHYPTRPAIPPVARKVSSKQFDGTKFSRLHTDHNVHRVVVVHGTFMGSDPIGIAEILRYAGSGSAVLKRAFDSLADKLSEAMKPLSDSLTRDVANYNQDFCDRFGELVAGDPQVGLLEPTWSSQNHHVARADLAIRLFMDLHRIVQSPDQRVLLWGHSHAGNGFALLSNLLANERKSVEQFFDAAGQDSDHWVQARRLLSKSPSPHPLARAIDIAAFGTPVRYGWDTAGYRTLTHVLHHQNAPDDPHRTKPLFPPHSLIETVSAEYGDWVQAFAIAGTDVPTGTSLKAHRRLNGLLASGLPDAQHEADTRFIVPKHLRDACARWKTGTRCHADGLNLLLEYEPSGRRTRIGRPVEQSVFGHGVATTLDWLPTHIGLVLESLDKQSAADH